MYIEPGTNIRLLSNVPLNNDYRDTIYFSSATAQANYFKDLTKYSLADNTYQRIQRGYARVAKCADDIYDCNYMMFQNTNYGDKWFYAFITAIEYINNAVSEIHFEIDVLQTWHFDYEMNRCYVERQHTESDDLFEHFEPESIEFGELISYTKYSGTVDWSDWMLVVCTPPLGDSTDTHVWKYNGCVSMAEYYICENTQSSVEHFIENVVGSAEVSGLISCYLFPHAFDSVDHSTTHTISENQSSPAYVDIGTGDIPTALDGYTPKNNKMFCSPYCVMEVTDDSGNSQFYKPELFDQDASSPKFRVYGKYIGTPEVLCVPLHYKGLAYNYEEAFSVTDFPQCALESDSYKAWLAMNGNAMVISTLANIGSFAGNSMTSLATGGTIGTSQAIQAGAGVVQNINSVMVANAMPNRLVTRDTSGVLTCIKDKHPWFVWKTCTAEYAQMVDDYFTQFGYNVGVIKYPNRIARPHWTYLQTRECSITGSVPADDMKLIRSIYDRGVRWWRQGSEIGDYTLDNSPS